MAAAAASVARRRVAALLPLLLRRLPPPTIIALGSPSHSPPSSLSYLLPVSLHHFSSKPRVPPISTQIPDHFDDEDGDDDDDESEGEGEEEEIGGTRTRGKTEKEKIAEAAEVGYRVVGPLEASENPFKPYEPVFAVVQIGSHQFKVSNGDSIFTERLKFCEVNDKLVLNKVLMLGSAAQTIIGRPILPEAAVHAVVEEHALDAKVIIFKKKRRKNYRRTKGHRQELTKLRIIDIQGIEKPINVAVAA